MSLTESIYKRLPVWGQHLAVSAYGLRWHGLRFGPGSREMVRDFTHREAFRAEEWERWRDRRLRELLAMTAERVPYYRQHWSAEEKRAARGGRLAALPLLEKDALRGHEASFVRQDRPRAKRFVFHTSGSTGTPIASIWTVEEIRRATALRETRSARWAGVSYSRPRATFSGRLAVPDPESRGPYHRFNLVERQVYFSPFHLSAATAPLYARALCRHRTEWLTGYAVSYHLLAEHILEQGLRLPPLAAVVTTSEKLLPSMRETMQRAYGCPIFEEYSTVENTLFASECERGRLHVSPDVGVVEILRPDGSACDPGEVGEVVATSLMRDFQPLVRYRVGDLAAWDDAPCPCGRAMPVLREVAGRVEDVVRGPDGRRMVRFHGIFADLPHVRQGQVVQETLRRIRVRVVPAPGWGEADAGRIAARIRQRLGPEVEVRVETVERIARTAAGKFQAVVSRLDAALLAEP